MPDFIPPPPSPKGESKPPRPKPVPSTASEPKEPPPAKGPLLPGKFKIQKIEADQPRQRRTPSVQFPKLEKQPSFFQMGWNNLKNLGKDNLVRISAAILIVGGILAFFVLRETRLQVTIQAGELTLQPEAAIVYDFTERIGLLRKELAQRIQPIQTALNETDASLSAAQADLAGRLQSKKLLQDTIEQDEKQMGSIIQGTRDKLKTLWDDEFKKIDDEYEKSKTDFNAKINERAQTLKLQLNKNSDLDAPEVIVNAFRLALYAAPKEVDVNAQRVWAENLLQQWRDEETKRATRREVVRKQIQEVREPVGGKIEEVKARINNMKNEIASIDTNLGVLQGEIAKYEERGTDLRKQISDTIQPFYDDLLRVPADYTRFTYSVQPDGILDVRNIEKNRDLKPGKHKLLLRAVRNADEYWSLVDFEIQPYKTNKLNITSDQFASVRDMLVK